MVGGDTEEQKIKGGEGYSASKETSKRSTFFFSLKETGRLFYSDGCNRNASLQLIDIHSNSLRHHQ